MTRNVLVGRAGSPGVGLGRLLLVAPEPNGHAAPAGGRGLGPAATDPASERARLLAALDTAATDLEALARQVALRAGDEIGAIFEAQALFARDPGIIGPALEAIDSGTSADVAILDSTDEQAGQLAAIDDEYFRARAADVRDVGRRVADLLCGSRASDLWHADGAPAIIVAEDLDPSAVATLRPELVAGIALGGGAPTGHAAIVARGLGIPLVLGLGGATADLATSAVGLVDGGLGRLIVEPDDADIASAALAPDAANAAPSPDERRRADHGQRQRRLGPRGDGGRPGRRRRDRPRPDRAAVPRSGDAAVGRRATRDLCPDPGRLPGPAGRLPDARRRWRQAGRVAGRVAPRRTRPSVSAASGSVSIDRPCSTTS